MNIKMKGKIAKNGKYLTSTDDVRLDVGGNGKWCIAGFAHNPDGQDIKAMSFQQSGDHYGHKDGEIVGARLIDTPQFFSRIEWATLDAARKDINEGVPLESKWGFPVDHFGKHVPITFRFLEKEGLGDCELYDIEVVNWSW